MSGRDLLHHQLQPHAIIGCHIVLFIIRSCSILKCIELFFALPAILVEGVFQKSACYKPASRFCPQFMPDRN